MSRLDAESAARGLVSSRSLASSMIKNGQVFVNGKAVLRPSFVVKEDDLIEIHDGELGKYVSRGGLKLEKALDISGIDVSGAVCCDIGASTGGFTDCLLKHGAKTVYAVEGGRGQLSPSLLGKDGVVSIEGFNAKELTADTLGEKVDVVVMDVSFISQTRLYQNVKNVLKDGGKFISLVKPQFEAGKGNVGKNGIVKDEKIRKQVLKDVTAFAESCGLVCLGTTESPIRGGDGNVEYLAWFMNEVRNEY